MNIAINPEAPQYRLSAKLTPIEEPMKITNKYKEGPLFKNANLILLGWVLLTIAGLAFKYYA